MLTNIRKKIFIDLEQICGVIVAPTPDSNSGEFDVDMYLKCGAKIYETFGSEKEAKEFA